MKHALALTALALALSPVIALADGSVSTTVSVQIVAPPVAPAISVAQSSRAITVAQVTDMSHVVYAASDTSCGYDALILPDHVNPSLRVIKTAKPQTCSIDFILRDNSTLRMVVRIVRDHGIARIVIISADQNYQ